MRPLLRVAAHLPGRDLERQVPVLVAGEDEQQVGETVDVPKDVVVPGRLRLREGDDAAFGVPRERSGQIDGSRRGGRSGNDEARRQVDLVG